MSVDATENLNAREGVQTTIEPASVRDRIEMSADEQRFLRFTDYSCPKVSRFVGMNFRRDFFHLTAQPGTSLCPRLGKSYALRAIFVASKRAEFL